MSPARPEDESRRAKDIALLEQVLERGNMFRALQRVERNGGAPGIDGMRTEELRAYLKENWPRHRTELLEGTYEPKPVQSDQDNSWSLPLLTGPFQRSISGSVKEMV